MKLVYALQPYEVGSKHAKSLALIIPAEVAKQYNINTSSVFALRVDEGMKRIMLQTFYEIIENCGGIIKTGPSSGQMGSSRESK